LIPVQEPNRLIVGIIALIALVALVGTGDVIREYTLPAFLVLAAASVIVRHIRATAGLADLIDIILIYRALWLLAWITGLHVYIPVPFPELVIAVGLVCFNRYLRGRSWKEMTLRWPESWRAWVLTLPFAVLSIAGLAWWYFFIAEHPHPISDMLPPWSTTALLAAVPVVATANGIFEELLARVILQSEARRVAGAWPAIVFQAALFGTMHYQAGFPSGWVGVGLTFTFGFVMGILTHTTRSVWPAVAVHILCDAFIVTLVVLERA
jgi:membrane protease YdiL (CAAX protease family)